MNLIEFKVPVYDDNGLPEFEEDNSVKMQVKHGRFHAWGVRTEVDETLKLAITNTVAIIEETESGQVILLNPEEITFI